MGWLRDALTGGGWSFTTNPGVMSVPSGGTFQFRQAGTYLINASVTFASGVTSRRICLHYRNGTEVRRHDLGSVGGPATVQVSYLLTAAANDTIDVRCFQNTGGALALGATPGHDLR